MKKIALVFDSDGTLHKEFMYKLLFDELQLDMDDFFNFVNEKRDKSFANNRLVDPVLVYFNSLGSYLKNNSISLTNEMLFNSGKRLDEMMYPGMPEAMGRYKVYAFKLGLNLENYIISSGSREILRGSSFNNFVKEIYACDGVDSESGFEPTYAMNDTLKTQALYWINKGGGFDHNSYVPHNRRDIPFENMIAFEDGKTGVPMLKMLKRKGGTSIGVYEEDSSEVRTLFSQGRINSFFKADYSDGSELDMQIKEEIKLRQR